MAAEPSSPEDTALHRWLWRMHGYAGLFVIPFIFYMTLTGLPFVWEGELENLWHPEYRALSPQPARATYESQLAAAMTEFGGTPLLYVKFDGDPRHATQFTFGTPGDPTSVFIDPSSGKVITHFREWTRLSFAAIALHGLTFIEPYGSWLLELLACWGIVLCISGVYLWWPRGRGSKVWGVLLPRLRAGGRTRWRDLHAVTGFYFSAALALYLLTGLPWTAFWGGKLLTTAAGAMNQSYPAGVTMDAGVASTPTGVNAQRLPLDEFVRFGLAQELPGSLRIELPTTTTGTVHLFNRLNRQYAEQHFHLDAYSGELLGRAGWSAYPVAQKAIAIGIDLHEGGLLGRTTRILATALAGTFMLMAGAAARMWWCRRPGGRLDWPKLAPRPAFAWPMWLTVLVLGAFMPLLGASFAVVLCAENLVAAGWFPQTARPNSGNST